MNTKIEWCDMTWNPVIGCTPVSGGCRNCFAARDALRLGANPNTPYYAGLATKTADGRPVFTGEVRCLEDRLEQPLRWRKPRRIFVNSMSDLFHPDMPDEFIDQVFAVMALAPQHTFQVLTKRPERLAGYMVKGVANRIDRAVMRIQGWDPSAIDRARAIPLPNVWFGVSAENQKTADERIPLLLQTPAAKRFVSCEPLLEPIELERGRAYLVHSDAEIDWVIVGGESGPRARPTDVDWVRDIVAQCRATEIPVFVKQLGAVPIGRECLFGIWPPHVRYAADHERILLKDRKGSDPSEWPEDLRVYEFPEAA